MFKKLLSIPFPTLVQLYLDHIQDQIQKCQILLIDEDRLNHLCFTQLYTIQSSRLKSACFMAFRHLAEHHHVPLFRSELIFEDLRRCPITIAVELNMPEIIEHCSHFESLTGHFGKLTRQFYGKTYTHSLTLAFELGHLACVPPLLASFRHLCMEAMSWKKDCVKHTQQSLVHRLYERDDLQAFRYLTDVLPFLFNQPGQEVRFFREMSLEREISEATLFYAMRNGDIDGMLRLYDWTPAHQGVRVEKSYLGIPETVRYSPLGYALSQGLYSAAFALLEHDPSLLQETAALFYYVDPHTSIQKEIQVSPFAIALLNQETGCAQLVLHYNHSAARDYGVCVMFSTGETTLLTAFQEAEFRHIPVASHLMTQ